MRLWLGLIILASIVACSDHSSVTGSDVATVHGDTIAIAVNAANVGPNIPANFMGLEFDPFQLQVRLPQNQGAATATANVLKALGTGVVRINAGDYCRAEYWWTPGTRDVRGDGCTVLTTADFDRFFQTLAAANWTAIVGVNFATAPADTSAAEAAYLQARYGSLLAAIEIGNEPDVYRLNRIRSASYTFAAYAPELTAFLAAMAKRAPGVPIAAPSTANDSVWLRETIGQAPSRFALATHHLYPFSGAAPPTAPSYATITNLLSETNRKIYLNYLKVAAAGPKSFGVPTRLAELNSANLGGVHGVSDVFASALWAVDYAFAAAEAGLVGVNIYGALSGNAYSPFVIANDGTISPRPVLYGLLAFQDAAKGQVVNLTPTNPRNRNFSAHASVTTSDGTVRIALVNRDTVTVPVRIVVPNGTSATVRRLVAGTTIAPLSDSTGVTYAGAKVTTSGTFTPTATETITPTGGALTVQVPPASAAVLIVATR